MLPIIHQFWGTSGNFSFCHKAEMNSSHIKTPINQISHFQHKNISTNPDYKGLKKLRGWALPCKHARTGTVLGRCGQHRSSTGPVLAHTCLTGIGTNRTPGFFTGIGDQKGCCYLNIWQGLIWGLWVMREIRIWAKAMRFWTISIGKLYEYIGN